MQGKVYYYHNCIGKSLSNGDIVKLVDPVYFSSNLGGAHVLALFRLYRVEHIVDMVHYI